MTASKAQGLLRAMVLGCALAHFSLAGHGQVATVITPDATLKAPNTPSSVTQAGSVYNINGGTTPPGSSNLFHNLRDC